MQRSAFILSFSPEPSMQYLTGQPVIQALQLMHFSSSIIMTGVSGVFPIFYFPLGLAFLPFFPPTFSCLVVVFGGIFPITVKS
jgi:hypothetical protein